MTPNEIIYGALERNLGIYSAEKLATEILEQIAAQGFVVVQADRVIQQAGKVSVTRKLVEDVLVDAEWWVRSNYIVNGEVHPSMVRHFDRDMADILALRAELQSQSAERESPAAQEARTHG